MIDDQFPDRISEIFAEIPQIDRNTRPAEAVRAGINAGVRLYSTNNLDTRVEDLGLLRQACLAMVHEAQYMGYCPNYTSIAAQLCTALAFDDLHRVDNRMTKAYTKWAGQPIGDVLLRSTGASGGDGIRTGLSVRSAEGMEYVDAANWMWVAHCASCKNAPMSTFWTTHKVDAEGVRPRTLFGPADPIYRLHVAIRRFMDAGGVIDVDAARVRWTKRVPAPNSYMTESPLYALFGQMLAVNPANLWYMYPRALGSWAVAGTTFNLDSMMMVAIRKLQTLLEANQVELAVHLALYDALDFRTKAVCLFLYTHKDKKGDQNEITAMKIQRLGGRPISVQSPTQRMFQSFHQAVCTADHDGALTGVEGPKVKDLLARFAAPDRPIMGTGSKLFANDSTIFMKDGVMKPVFAAMRRVLLVKQEAIHAAVALDAMNPRLGNDDETAPDWAAAATMLREAGASFSAEAALATPGASKWKWNGVQRVCNINTGKAGCSDHVRMIFDHPGRRGHDVTLTETDSRKFTPWAPGGMFTFPAWHQPTPTEETKNTKESAAYRISLLIQLGISQTLMMCTDQMGKGAKIHGPGCTCLTPEAVNRIHAPGAAAEFNVPEGYAWGFSNGSTGQGFSGQCSTIWMIAAESGVAPLFSMVVNGDDQAGKRRCEVEHDMLLGEESSLGVKNALCALQAANFLISVSARSFGMARAGTAPSSKKTVANLASGHRAAHTVVYHVLGVDGSVLLTWGPSQANAIGEISQKSFPAYISTKYREIVMNGHAEGYPQEQITACMEVANTLLPDLKQMFKRHKASKQADKELHPNFNPARDERLAGEALSIWSGSTTILEQKPDALERALREVVEDTAYAPEWAIREARDNRRLYLPVGRPIRELRVGDRYGEHLSVASKTVDWLHHYLSFRAPKKTLSSTAWLSKAAHLEDPLTSWDDYADGTYIQVPRPGEERTAVLRMSVGDPHPTGSIGRERIVRLYAWPGATSYDPTSNAEVSIGRVVSASSREGEMLVEIASSHGTQHIRSDLSGFADVKRDRYDLHDAMTVKYWVVANRDEVSRGNFELVDSVTNTSLVGRWSIIADTISVNVPSAAKGFHAAAEEVGRRIGLRLGAPILRMGATEKDTAFKRVRGCIVGWDELAFDMPGGLRVPLRVALQHLSPAATTRVRTWLSIPKNNSSVNRSTISRIWCSADMAGHAGSSFIWERTADDFTLSTGSTVEVHTDNFDKPSGTCSPLALVLGAPGGWMETTVEALTRLQPLSVQGLMGVALMQLPKGNVLQKSGSVTDAGMNVCVLEDGRITEVATGLSVDLNGLNPSDLVGASTILRLIKLQSSISKPTQ